MAYLYDFKVELTATAEDGVIATNNSFILSAQAVDYTTTQVLLVPLNSEVQVQLPGTNRLVAFSASSDSLFDVAISTDVASQPIYTGMYGNTYSRLIKLGAELSVFSIKASTTDAVVKLSVVGLEAL